MYKPGYSFSTSGTTAAMRRRIVFGTPKRFLILSCCALLILLALHFSPSRGRTGWTSFLHDKHDDPVPVAAPVSEQQQPAPEQHAEAAAAGMEPPPSEQHSEQMKEPKVEQVYTVPQPDSHDVPFNREYYNEGVKENDESRRIVYHPYPDYNSPEWRKEHKGDYRSCIGPRGTELGPDDRITGYQGLLKRFPKPALGSNRHLGIDESVCFDRDRRFEPYGEQEGSRFVDWNTVNWGALQEQCLERNRNRYDGTDGKRRTAIVFRSYIGFEYDRDVLHNLRAMIQETTLWTGGEYQVYLVVDASPWLAPEQRWLKTFSPDKLQDPHVHELLNAQFIPPEFHEITFFFSRDMMRGIYPKVGEYEPLYQIYQGLTYFASLHAQYDQFWQFEMDYRYTGHHYEYMEAISEFAKQQPRRHLWERSSGFYIPSVHGSFADYAGFVKNNTYDGGIWGPVRVPGITPQGPTAPDASLESNADWGVGEEADVITFIPIFDPAGTHWWAWWIIYNNPSSDPEQRDLPRRSSPVAMGRFSRRLLMAEHSRMMESGITALSEMTTVSNALWNGFKAVFAHPANYMRMHSDDDVLMNIFNHGWLSGEGKGSGGSNSVWSCLSGCLMAHLSFFWKTNFPRELYHRWLGEEIDGEGGAEWERVHGRLCFPPMILHPIKTDGMK